MKAMVRVCSLMALLLLALYSLHADSTHYLKVLNTSTHPIGVEIRGPSRMLNFIKVEPQGHTGVFDVSEQDEISIVEGAQRLKISSPPQTFPHHILTYAGERKYRYDNAYIDLVALPGEQVRTPIAMP